MRFTRILTAFLTITFMGCGSAQLQTRPPKPTRPVVQSYKNEKGDTCLKSSELELLLVYLTELERD